MNYNVFIDDEREPPNDGRQWIVCRNQHQFIQCVFDHNKYLPNFISFDHDLGEKEPSGHEIAKWIVNMVLDDIVYLPKDFDFYVHSQNPIGKKNIEGLLNPFLEAIKKSYEISNNEERFQELWNASENDSDEGNIIVGKLK